MGNIFRKFMALTDAGKERMRMEWDYPNSRLSVKIGTTEIMQWGAGGVSGMVSAPEVYGLDTGISANAGGGQASATALTKEINDVTVCASDFDSVKLPTAAKGLKITVKNSSAAILSVFPFSGDAINGMAADLSVDVPAGGELTFSAISAAAWIVNTSLTLPAPATQKGNLVVRAANNAGNTQTVVTNAAMGQAATLTIPDPGGATASFVMTEAAQTVNGVKTFGSPLVYKSATAISAHAGGGQGSATALAAEYNLVATVASNFDSVALPAAVTGQHIVVKNNSANILSVFPATGDSINALAANLSIDLGPGAEMVFRAVDATVWHTKGSLNLAAPSTQKGSLNIVAADMAGNTQLKITNAALGQAATYTIPDAGAAASFMMSGKSMRHVVPACGNAKVGATAGWVITGGTDKCSATLPASQTNSTLVVPITGLDIGDILTGVCAVGQVESAGNIATLNMDIRRLTAAAADLVDASVGSDASGNMTADTKLDDGTGLVKVTGLAETVAVDCTYYALFTGTTAAATDIDLMGIIVTKTRVG